MRRVKARDRFLIALLAVALGFGGFWVGRAITGVGHEYARGASQVNGPTARAGAPSHDRLNLVVLFSLLAGGATFVLVPALFAIPQRRRRSQWRPRPTR